MICIKASAKQLLFLTALLCTAHFRRIEACFPEFSSNFDAIRGLGIKAAQAFRGMDVSSAADGGGYSAGNGFAFLPGIEACNDTADLVTLNEALQSIYYGYGDYDPSAHDPVNDGFTGTWTYEDLVYCAGAEANATSEGSQCEASLLTPDAYKFCTPACRVWWNAVRGPCDVSYTATMGQYVLNVFNTYCSGSDPSPYTCSTRVAPTPLPSTPSSAPSPDVSPVIDQAVLTSSLYGNFYACVYALGAVESLSSWDAKLSLCDASLQDPHLVPGTCTAACRVLWTSVPDVCVGLGVALLGQEVASTLDYYCGCCGSSYVDDTSGWSSAPDPIAFGPAPSFSLSRKLKM